LGPGCGIVYNFDGCSVNVGTLRSEKTND
jgi:hypothetical protein